MEQQMDLMADLVQKISGELRTGLQHAYENFLGFFHAIDWKRMLPLLLLLQMGLLTISRTSSLSSLSSTSRKEDLPKMVYDYYASGAEDQWTLQENRNAFSKILPQILIDVSKIDVSTTVVDTPRLGRREFDIKNRFALPRGLMLKNFEMLDLGKIK